MKLFSKKKRKIKRKIKKSHVEKKKPQRAPDSPSSSTNTEALTNGSSNASDAGDNLYSVVIPAGPIGLILGSSPEGPTVHQIKPSSPIVVANTIEENDVFVQMDGIDCTSLCAVALSKLLIETQHEPSRRITLKRAHNPVRRRVSVCSSSSTATADQDLRELVSLLSYVTDEESESESESRATTPTNCLPNFQGERLLDKSAPNNPAMEEEMERKMEEALSYPMFPSLTDDEAEASSSAPRIEPKKNAPISYGSSSEPPSITPTPPIAPSINPSIQQSESETALSIAASRREEDQLRKAVHVYKRKNKRLKASYHSMKKRLQQTEAKLEEVVSNSNFRIDVLESQQSESDKVVKSYVNITKTEMDERLHAIKTLAHVTKKQKKKLKKRDVNLTSVHNELEAMKADMEQIKNERDTLVVEHERLQKEWVRVTSQNSALLETQEGLIQKARESNDQVARLEQERLCAYDRLEEMRQQLETLEREQTGKKTKNGVDDAMMQIAEDLDGVHVYEGPQRSIKGENKKLQIQGSSVRSAELEQGLVDAYVQIGQLKKELQECELRASKKAHGGRRRIFSRHLSFNNKSPASSQNDNVHSDDHATTLREREEEIVKLKSDAKAAQSEIADLKSKIVRMSSSYKQGKYVQKTQVKKLVDENVALAREIKLLEMQLQLQSDDVVKPDHFRKKGPMQASGDGISEVSCTSTESLSCSLSASMSFGSDWSSDDEDF